MVRCVDDERTVKWIAAVKKTKTVKLMTSAIPELGFLRVSVQRTGGRVTVQESGETLAGMLSWSIDDHGGEFVPVSARLDVSGLVPQP
jgi:hypothetical protein